MNPSPDPLYPGGCDSVIWGKIKSVTVETGGSSGFSWSNPDGSSCASSGTSEMTKTFGVADFTSTVPCCGCGYTLGNFSVENDTATEWSYSFHPASGPDVNQSGQANWQMGIAVVFRANPDTGACEFSIQISGGVTGGTFNACCFPPLLAAQSPWLPVSELLGAHTVSITQPLNQTADGCNGSYSISATLTLSAT